MPCCLIPLPDIEQTVLRPSVYQIVKQIYDIADLPEDTEIVFAGKRGTVATPGSAQTGETSPMTKFASSNVTFISVTEDYVSEAVQEIQPMAWDNRPIFVDSAVGLNLRPIYLPSSVEIEINFRHSSETEIRKWISKMMSKVAHGKDINLHDISYSYPISHEFTLLMEAVHTLIENNEGYGDDLTAYFNKHRSARMTILSNQAGEQRHIVVTEKQTQILGHFSFPVVPDKPEHIPELGLWQGRFTYNYKYERPDQLLVQYPISAHNQYLPEKYWKHLEDVIDYHVRPHYQSFSYTALQSFAMDNLADQTRDPYPYLRIPSFDDFGERYDNTTTIFNQDTATIMTALCFLDTDKVTLLDLKELGDCYIDPDILSFLKSESSYLTKLYFSVFNISVYVDGIKVQDNVIEVTSDLIVRFKQPRSQRQRYHVRLSGLPNIGKPLYDALMRLSRHSAAFFKTVRAMNELLAIDPDFANWEKTQKVEHWMFTAIYRVLFVSHQGNINSTGTNLYPYLTENMDTIRNNLHLLTQLDPKVIQDYFEHKRRLRLTRMNAFLIARPLRADESPLSH